MQQSSPTSKHSATRTRSRRGHRFAMELEPDSPSGRWLLELPDGAPVDAIVAELLPAQARIDQRRRRLREQRAQSPGSPTRIRKLLDKLECEILAAVEFYGPLRGPIKLAQRPWSQALDRIAAAREASSE